MKYMSIRVDNTAVLKINSFIISLIVFLNIYQIGLNWLFGISFNMAIEYLFIPLLFMINKFQLKIFRNYKLVFYMYFMILSFTITFYLNNNAMLSYYFNHFVLYGLILLIVFLFPISHEYLYKYILWHSYAITLIYMSALFMGKVSIIHDYMTWGYYCVFGLSFILGDAIINKKFFKLIFLIPLLGIAFINGPKGAFIIITALLIICFYQLTNSWLKRVSMLIILLILALNFVGLLNGLIKILENISFTANSYFINSLKSVLSVDKISGVFDNRDFIYEYGIHTIEENVFGIGIGKFQSTYGVFPHNIFLDIFSTYGILLGGLIVVFLVYEIATCFMVVKNKKQLIIFIVVLSNSFKLLVSKTFIYDPVFWLLICIMVVIKGKKDSLSNNKLSN
ncbi:hypothetical protein CN901_26315 [Bacillus cereus]|nr:hypothetical protein [Bacillus thuringiensis]PEW10860.1 hypothetical protein CN440_14185 [Bacillus cereus]MRC48270.1 hypothetical protein [Bacillus thuringiensis]MRD26834.1 hypothetical protein [Bacillus thuringiensis]PEZ22273.1 hypothetical protein CN365_05680 [Bacillus cereus]